MFDSENKTTSFDLKIVHETGSKIRSFLYELAEGTSNYKSLHNLTEQVEHQYHGRFLIELLQNAHDALLDNADQNQEYRIEIVLEPNDGPYGALYIANDGKPFSESNFRSLSQLGQSDKDPQESIGNKGIGFRSVLEITTSPEIYSRSTANSPTFDGYCFSFCPTVIDKFKQPIIRLYEGEDHVPSPLGANIPLVDWGSEILEKLRKSISPKDPTWLPQELKYLSPYLLPFPIIVPLDNSVIKDFQKRGFVTAIRLPFKNAHSRDLAKKKLEEVDANTILFLNRAGSLLLDSGIERRKLDRKRSKVLPGAHNGHEVVIQDSTEAEPRYYWIWNHSIKTDEASTEFRNSLMELPGKWPELKEAVLSFAVRLGDAPEKGVFSIFLPTELPTGCAAHISAPFFGDMSRTDIDFENAYNGILLRAAAQKAMEVSLTDLKAHGVDEARAIIDLLSPWPDEKLPGARWFENLKIASEMLEINLCEELLALTDSGWNSFECTSLIPSFPTANFLTEEKLRQHACFPAFSKALSGREFLIKSFFGAIKIDPFPLVGQKADTVESIAKDLHKEGGKAEWNAFWIDAISFFEGDSIHLRGKEVLLGTDNALHAFGEECAVFFTPRQGSLDDEEVLNEGALHEIPNGLKSYVAFLHEEIQIYDEKDARIQTQIRKFLDTKLVQRFRVEDILNSVLIRRTPNLPVSLKSPEGDLCRDILLWGLSLVSSLVDRGKGEKTLRLLKSLPVPCRGGWYELRHASFGPGWQGTLGKYTLGYLRGANSPDCKEASKRLLVGPQDERWGTAGEKYQQILRDAGVFDGLKLSSVDPGSWQSRFYASLHAFHLPDACPLGIPEELRAEYADYVNQKIRLAYHGYFKYEMQEFSVIPGLEKYPDFDEPTRKSFMHILLGSIAKWKPSWLEADFKKIEGLSDKSTLLSPAFFALKQLPWLGTETDDGVDWSKASERWYVTCERLSGKPRLFAHLKPLSGRLAQLLDGDPLLAAALAKLGMPKFDTENRSESTRLLNDLASALDGDVTELNVFLGQVRDAWGAFEPEDDSQFPPKLIIRRGNNPITVHIPSADQPVYLPDSTASFVDALEQFSLPVIAIDISDAKRLSEGFKNFYGDGVQLASSLNLKPLVDGNPWNEMKNGLLADSELEWIIPMILSFVAFTGVQAKGTNSDPFQKRVQIFREARICWVPNLEAGLFKGDEIVVSPQVPALWLEKEKVLLATEETRDQPYLLSEALAFLIQRDDLEVYIKFALKEIGGSDPDSDERKNALLEHKISEDQFLEAREQWRGDLGPLIRMIRPLVMLLAPSADIGKLVELETEEAVLAFLHALPLQGFSGADILTMARTSRNIADLGKSFWEAYGEKAQLRHWNSMLEKLGEPPIQNSNAASELRSHIVSATLHLCSLIAGMLRGAPELGRFTELAEKLQEVECPETFIENFWVVDFSMAMKEVVPIFKSIGTGADLLEVIQSSSSPEDLRDRLSFAGIDISFDPFQAAKSNRDNLKRMLQAFQRAGLAWCLNQNNTNTAPWEAGVEQLADRYSGVVEQSGYLRVWDDGYLFGQLKLLPRDDSHAVLWQKVDASSTLSELLNGLLLSSKDLDEAQARLDNFKEQIRRQKKLVPVCGREFDSSEDNLSNLWTHICEGITDDGLSNFDVLNLKSLTKLKPVGSRKKKTTNGGGEKKKPSRGPLSKSMENLIGLSGEIHAFRLLQKSYGASVVHSGTWVSGNSSFVYPDNKVDDGRGCDFVILHEGKTFCIEVKASQGEDESFKLGSSEIRLAMDLAKKKRNRNDVFQILHVTNALSESPSFRLLPNPYDQRYQSYFDVEDADARVRYKQP
jgi:hypothetical protein